MTQKGFQQALAKLVNDKDYRSKVEGDPSALKSDFALDDSELEVLARVGAVATDKVTDGPPPPCCCCCCI
jgi:hypothetical protein